MNIEEVSKIAQTTVDRVWESRYEKDKIHIYIEGALKKVYIDMLLEARREQSDE